MRTLILFCVLVAVVVGCASSDGTGDQKKSEPDKGKIAEPQKASQAVVASSSHPQLTAEQVRNELETIDGDYPKKHELIRFSATDSVSILSVDIVDASYDGDNAALTVGIEMRIPHCNFCDGRWRECTFRTTGEALFQWKAKWKIENYTARTYNRPGCR